MKFHLWQKVTLGLILGVLVGLIFREKVSCLKPMGDIFIKMIKMVIVPLVFFAIVGGITSVSDTKILGRLGLKASIAYILTTSFAILIGFCSGWFFKPGAGVHLDFDRGSISSVSSDLSFQKFFSAFLSIIPDNAIGAMANGEILQVVFFAIFTGITLHQLSKQQKERAVHIFQLMSSIVFKMVHLITALSPYAAFALTAWVVGMQGLSVLKSLLKLIVGMVSACALQYVLFGLMIKIFAKVSPFPFYRKSFEYQALAFSTSSSKAALAIAIRAAQEKLGISKTSSSFLLPLGVSINMSGMAIYLGLCALFFAQATGKILTYQDYMVLMFTSTLGSIGGAGIPGGSLVMLPMILTSIGLPIEGIALIAGVDRILDMIRSTINITGDVAVSLCVDSSEKQFNSEVYYSSY